MLPQDQKQKLCNFVANAANVGGRKYTVLLNSHALQCIHALLNAQKFARHYWAISNTVGRCKFSRRCEKIFYIKAKEWDGSNMTSFLIQNVLKPKINSNCLEGHCLRKWLLSSAQRIVVAIFLVPTRPEHLVLHWGDCINPNF